VSKEQDTKALILAPSKELCQQIHTNFMELTTKCSREICCVDISPQVSNFLIFKDLRLWTTTVLLTIG
jgi:superfamily II DNA/RNA helicase